MTDTKRPNGSGCRNARSRRRLANCSTLPTTSTIRAGGGPEQFRPGVGGQQVHRALSGVGVRRRTEGGQHRLDGQPDHRGGGDLGVQRPRGEHAEEPVLAGDLAVRAEDPGAHLERRHVAGQGGAGGGLGQQQVRRMRAGRGQRVVVDGLQHGVPQDAKARTPHQRRIRPVTVLFVPAVAEENHVPGDQPVQEIGGLGHLLGRPRGERAAQFGRCGGGRRGQGSGVADHRTDVVQRMPQLVLDRLCAFRVGQPVDQDVHPGLGKGERGFRGPPGFAGDLLQHAVHVAGADQNGVQHPVHGDVVDGQRPDDRIHQRRHVVGDDVDDRLGVRPAGRALGARRGRVEDPDLDLAGCPSLAHPPVAVDDAEHVLGGLRLILGGHVPEVGVDHRRAVGPQRDRAGHGGVRIQLVGLVRSEVRRQRGKIRLRHRLIRIMLGPSTSGRTSAPSGRDVATQFGTEPMPVSPPVPGLHAPKVIHLAGWQPLGRLRRRAGVSRALTSGDTRGQSDISRRATCE